MEYRSLSVVAVLIALGLSASLVQAESRPSAEQEADWGRRLEKSGQLQAQGKAQKQAADKLYDAKYKACYEKFQVNACRDEARRENAQLTNEARRVENEGKALERQVKKEQLSDKDARYQAEADQRAADLKAREAETSSERRASADHEATQRADKERQAEEGSKRHAENAERLRKKQAEHQARVDKKKAEAARKAAAAAK